METKNNNIWKFAFIFSAVIAVIAIVALIVVLVSPKPDTTEQTSPSKNWGISGEPTPVETMPLEIAPKDAPYHAALENYANVVYALNPTYLSYISPKEYVEYEQIIRETNPLASLSQEMSALKPALDDAIGLNAMVSCSVISQRQIPAETLIRIAESAAVFGVPVDDMAQGYIVEFSVKLTGDADSITCPPITRTLLQIGSDWYCVVVKENETFPLEPFVYFLGMDNTEHHPYYAQFLNN